MPNSLAPEHKHYYSNSVTLLVNDNDAFVSFGLSHDHDPSTMERSATIHMTHKSMKVLYEVLKIALNNFEQTNGPIVLPQGFVDKIQSDAKINPSSNE